MADGRHVEKTGEIAISSQPHFSDEQNVKFYYWWEKSVFFVTVP